MNNDSATAKNPLYTRACSLAELTNIQIEIEDLMKDWYEDDIKLNFSTLAIIEVLANIFEHGADPQNKIEPEVELSISHNDKTIIALFKDNAFPIPENAILAMTGVKNEMPATDVSQDNLPDSGWGLNLVQHATKSVKYKRNDNLNYLELTFDCVTES